MPKLVLVGTNGIENPTRAVIPLDLTVGATKATEPIEPHLALIGDAVILLKPAVIESLVPVGYPPLKELVGSLVEHRVPIYV